MIGNLLSAEPGSDRMESVLSSLRSPSLNWSLFIATGNSHFVLQTMYCKLQELKLTDYLPVEVDDHLKLIYELNHRRNTEILQQVSSINSLLNSQGIVPLYLKGVGNILDGLYADLSERIMCDIDLLVPDDQFEATALALLENGYQECKKYDPRKRKVMKHYPTLSKPGARAPVEIHRLPVDYEYSGTFDADEVWEQKKKLTGSLNAYVMGDQHKMVHNFIHAQLHHEGYLYARVLLRDLYDLWLLSKHEDPESVFGGMNRYHKQAAGYLKIMYKAFGDGNSGKPILGYSCRTYLFRHKVNLRTGKVLRTMRIVVRIFRAYVKLPFRAIGDKELRRSVIKRLVNRQWYAQHLKSYRRM